MEKALVEMYLAGVSVRRVEDITEALWGSRVSSCTISELNQKYVSLCVCRRDMAWGGAVQSVSVLVAIGVNKEGYREIFGVAEGSRDDAES